MKTKILLILFLIISVSNYSQVLQQWVTRTTNSYFGNTGMLIAADSAGNNYVAGLLNNQVVTIKYNASGIEVWSRIFATATDACNLAVDSLGNVILCGSALSNGGFKSDFVTIKYNSSGATLWSKVYSIPGNVVLTAYDMTVDNSGNVYVAGGTSTVTHIFKYNSFGDSVWNKTMAYGTAKEVSVDLQGNVYVAGSTSDYFILKYNSFGILQWLNTFDGGIGGADLFSDMLLDASGNVYVTGKSHDNTLSYDYFTFKCNGLGSLIWSRRLTRPNDDAPSDMEIDRDNNIYITGSFTTPTFYTEYGTVKYDSNGTLKWSKSYQGPSTGGSATSIEIDSFGDIYITGGNGGITTGWDYVTVKYNTLGDTLWTMRYSGTPGALLDRANDICIDNTGNVIVTGKSSSAGSLFDFATVKYIQSPRLAPTALTASGISSTRINLTWLDANTNESGFKIERSTNAGANWILKDSVSANVLAYSDSLLSPNTIYHYRVYAYNSAGVSGYSNIAFDTTLAVTGIVLTNEIPAVFKLYDNYPNPFNPSTTIVFQIPLSRGVSASGGRGVLTSLIIYDLLGREVKTLVNQNMQPGKYSVIFNGGNLASGVYFYKLVSGKFTETKKMALIK